MLIALVGGARPNFVKIAPLVWELCSRRQKQLSPAPEFIFIHTGQHFDAEMSSLFLDELELAPPAINLGVSRGSNVAQSARIMLHLEEALKKIKPDVVIVVGDVNSTLAAALTATKMGLPLAHVEAGLRSFDRTMPEEINRLVTDHLSDYLFTPTVEAGENLRREGIPEEKIFFVGNIIIDTLIRLKEKACQLASFKKFGLEKKNYALLTLHRPANVDDGSKLANILFACHEISKRLPVIFPVHPRTKAMIKRFHLEPRINSASFLLIPPLGYLEFLSLMQEARLVLTDSGGVQEETTFLSIPCLTLRPNTERPITVSQGTNRVVGTSPEIILAEALARLDGPEERTSSIPELWDGKTAGRIIEILVVKLKSR